MDKLPSLYRFVESCYCEDCNHERELRLREEYANIYYGGRHHPSVLDHVVV
jgi:hypothetical protein